MSYVVIGKNYNPLTIKIKHVGDLKNERVLFLWEDAISKNVKYTDTVDFSSNVEYFSTLNKSIDFFENGIKFKIVLTRTYETLFESEFKNTSFIKGKKVLYISQNGYSGYSYAARNYIYQLLTSGYEVQWDARFTNKNIYRATTKEERLVEKCLFNKINYDSVIIHHTPEIWKQTIFSLKNPYAHTYGLTTWETTHIPESWVSYINTSVNELIVPSRFNVETFKNSGIKNKINLWYHDIFPPDSTGVSIDNLISKFEIYKNGKYTSDVELIKNIIKNKTVYYNISQYSSRKNINQLLQVFCERFDDTADVCLLIKTHLENFDDKDKHTIRYKLHDVLKKYKNAPNIIFCFESLDEPSIIAIHKLGSVYFTLNRGEGFGLCTYTAKKMGNKVICGLFGAEKEFLDDGDTLLDYRLDHTYYLDDFNKYYIDDRQKCAYYDTDYVVSKLKYYTKKSTIDI